MKRFLLPLLAGLCCSVSFAQVTPDKAISTMKVADGLQIELFAAEPMVINPTGMDIDHLGRVWITEAVNYRRTNFNRPILRPEGDRVVILTDKDGDGKADESTVFYQGKDLYGPLGLAVAKDARGPGYKVFVCQSPNILLFEDKDGDGKADGPPVKFLTGAGGFDHDHGVHGINIGPDGKLYFTIGDTGVRGLQSTDGKGRKWDTNSTDCRAGTVWRCDIDGKNLELIAHNFRNNYECCINSFGEIWLSDNDDDGNQQTRICFVMPGGNYGYYPRGAGQSHWHEEQPGIVHKALRTGFGSPTGICFYEGTLLPKKYQGQLLHCDAGPRELRAFIKTPKGAGFDVEKELLVTSTDSWFRLADVCVAPDGSVLMADWYDPGVGGHGMGDWTRGRVYRLTPKGHTGYKIPAVKLETNEGVLAALASPCLATRAIALDYIRGLSEEKALATLKAGLKHGDNPIIAMRSVWAAGQVASSEMISRLVSDARDSEHSDLQLGSVRLIANEMQKLGFTKPVNKADDKEFDSLSKGLLREQMILFSKLRDVSESNEIFYAFAKRYDGQDIFYRAALNIACGTDPVRRDAILADFDKQFPEWNEKVADLVWELRPKSMLPKLRTLLVDKIVEAKSRSRIVDILASSDDPGIGKDILKLLGTDLPAEIQDKAFANIQTFLPTKWAALKNDPAFAEVCQTLLKKPETSARGLSLIALAGDTKATAQVVTLVKDPGTPPAIRDGGIATLGNLINEDALKTLKDLASGGSVPAVNALGGHLPQGNKDKATSKAALEALESLITSTGTVEVKSAAVSTLAGNRNGTIFLLDAHSKKTLPTELLAVTGRMLRNSPFQDLRNKAMIAFPPPGKLDPKKLPPISELVKRTGNAEHGRLLLSASLKGESQCLLCHMVRGQGGNIGPDLSMIGKKASRENLFESILVPSKAIADQYIQQVITTTAGTQVSGLLIEETPKFVVLRDANGKDTKIEAADIDERKKSMVSLMPENLVATLSEDDLIDLVEYLQTLKTASLTPDVWQILGPFDNDEADKALDIDFGPEKTLSLGGNFKGKGDKPITAKTVKLLPGGYVDLAAHYGQDGVNSASYVLRVIDSPKDQTATILLGNDDGAKVWVGDKLVFTNRDHFAATPEKHRITVSLKKGANPILMKIVNGSNPHGFYLTIQSEEELKLLPMK